MSLKFDLLEENSPPCKGLTFRARRNTYLNKKREIVDTVKLYLLKKRSCDPDECEHCGSTYDQIPDYLDTEAIQFDHMVDGELYTITWENMGRGFEDLYDEYEMKFTLIKK